MRREGPPFSWVWLFDLGEGLDLRFQSLVVLALDLKFGLEFFDEQLQSCDFNAQFLEFVSGSRRP